jgi:hypothetical protein
MKRSHVLVSTTMLAFALAGVFGQAAVAANSKLRISAAGPPPAAGARGGGPGKGTIGKAPPSPNAASRIRALGRDDDGDDSAADDEDGGAKGTGKAGRGAIGKAPPSRNAAGRIRALGRDS